MKTKSEFDEGNRISTPEAASPHHVAAGSFPLPDQAPPELRAIHRPSGCGPVAAWEVLAYFQFEPDPNQIIDTCRFRPDKGTYMADIAAALAGCGLTVEVSGELDPDPSTPVDESEYQQAALSAARGAGVTFRRGLMLRELEPILDGQRVAIVQYNTELEEMHAHITPLTRVANLKAELPFEMSSTFDLDALEWGRGYPGISRQLIIASRRI